jgi:oligopeptide/dipeptide ABC transporter ATP-binding protein
VVNPLLQVIGLSKRLRTSDGIVHVLDEVTLEIGASEILGLIGESGCGKSTLCKTLVRLYEPDGGQIILLGRDISHLGRRTLRPFRRYLQILFEDPCASLNPRSNVGRILEEPLIVHGIGDAGERHERVAWLMQRVGLRPEQLALLPHEFALGERQRIAIARAIALRPKIVACDEPAGALDMSARASVINLLVELQREFGISYLFSSNDLPLVQHVADRVAVMCLGRIVEIGDRRRLWSEPAHPYTRALLAAAPRRDASGRGGRRPQLLGGDSPGPLPRPSGCRFRTRCTHATEICAQSVPPLRPLSPSQSVACHHAERLLVAPHADKLAANANTREARADQGAHIGRMIEELR